MGTRLEIGAHELLWRALWWISEYNNNRYYYSPTFHLLNEFRGDKKCKVSRTCLDRRITVLVAPNACVGLAICGGMSIPRPMVRIHYVCA